MFVALVIVALGASVTPVASAQPALGQGVLISEFMASNPGPFADEDGDSSDWIELWNSGPGIASLGGWTLRDDGNSWTLPEMELAVDERAVVWASGKERNVLGAPLHSSFKLSSSGEYLALHDTIGQFVSGFTPAYEAQLSGVSYGTSLDGAVGFLAESTPGAANSALRVEVVASPTAAVGSVLTDAATVETLSSATPNATVRYTLDGTEPTPASTVAIDGQVAIAPTAPVTVLRAIATAPGLLASPESVFTYVHPSQAASAIGGGAAETTGIAALPVVTITTPSGDEVVEIENYEAVRIDYVDPSGPGFSAEVGARRFGAWSLNRPKQNYRVNFSRSFGPSDLEYPLFSDRGQGSIVPATTFDQLELRAYSLDSFAGPNPLHLSNEFARSLTLALGTPSSHSRPVGVFVNGSYRGVYELRERINEDWLSEYFGGDGDDYESWFIDDTLGTADLNNGTGEVFEAIDAATGYQQVKHLIDARSLVNSALVLWNYSTYTEREWRLTGPSDPAHPEGFVWIPNDLDLAFTQRYVPGRSDGMRDYIARFATDPEFRAILHDQSSIAFCGDGEMTVSKMTARIERLAADIRPAMAAELAAWDWSSSVSVWESNVALATSRIESGVPLTKTQWRSAGWFPGCPGDPPVVVAHQSSTGYGGAAERAIDGRTDGIYPNGSVTHTLLEGEPWLEVDLGDLVHVGEVTLWNRTDCCADRLSDFHVLVSEVPFTSNSLAGAQSQAGVLDLAFAGQAGTSESFAVNRAGRYVRVQLEGTNYLSLAEVQVQSDVLADTVEPDAVIDSPADRSVLADTNVTLAGTATDNVGVASVRVAIKNRDTGEWLQEDGSFGAGSKFLFADVASPGAASTAWSFTADLPEARLFAVVRAEDTSAIRDSTKPKVLFEIEVPISDVADPNAEVITPAAREELAGPSVVLTGTATDDSAVSRVRVTVTNRATGQRLQADGSFAASFARIDTVLSNPGATSTDWSFPVALADGEYVLVVDVIDGAGKQDQTRPRVVFTVSSAVADTVVPDTTIDSPTVREALAGPAVTVLGTATDNVGVTRVRVTIQDVVTKQYLQDDGTFGGFNLIEATVDTNGALSTGWSLPANLPAGEYATTARAVDAAGNTDDTRPRVRFSVN